jgi:RNA-binding protein
MKIKIRTGDRDERAALIDKLCSDHDAALIQQIGSVALLYRANPDKKPEKRLRIPSR